MPRPTTFRDLLKNLHDMVEKNPDIADCMVFSVHSSSGATDHINSFHVHTLEEYDLENEFCDIFEDEGLKVGDKVISLSVGGN